MAAAVLVLIVLQATFSYGWLSNSNLPVRIRCSNRANNIRYEQKIRPSSITSTSTSQLEEPDNQFGRMTYWDESYRESLVNNSDNSLDGQSKDTSTFSW